MSEHVNNLTTLCYIEQDDQYLMLHRVKKKQDVNQDKWIGIGGHFEAGESPEECLLREVREETGLGLTSWQFRGIVTFTFQSPQSAEYRGNPEVCSNGKRKSDDGNAGGCTGKVVRNGMVQSDMEYMCLYTADGFEGTLADCEEGMLEWVKKSQVLQLPIWEGDRIFFYLLETGHPFFSLKLDYIGERLERAVLDGKEMELFDIRKEDGSLTGLTRERTLAHEDGTIHGTAHVWIVRPDGNEGWEILLQKRSRNKDSFPGCYDISSAGHLPAGSDFMESALRELEEELGIRASENELQYIGMHKALLETAFYGRPWKNYEISAVYLYQEPVEIRNLVLQQEEIESVKWMDLELCLAEVYEGKPEYCIFADELEMVKEYVRRKKYE